MDYAPNTKTLEELRATPIPEFFERDTAQIKEKLVGRFEAETGRTLYPAQTETLFIDLLTYALSMWAEAGQSAALQNRAVWAEGLHLDDVGANVSTYRLKAAYTGAKVRFTLSGLRASGVVVPKGTRVSAGTALVFSTTQELVIAAGDLFGDVDVIADQAGADYNDLQLGQIEDILDPVAYIASVANILPSAGGSDVEGDDRFRDRVTNALERISRGGSKAGYIENVKAINSAIVDVQPIRTQPGYIEITPLMVDGISSDVIDAEILAYLDPETMRPQGDYVTIRKADPVVFDVVMTLKVSTGMVEGISGRAEDAVRDQFDIWGKSLGAQIAPSALVEAVRGIFGVIGVTGPEFPFTDLPITSFATLGVLTIVIEEAENV